MAIRYTFGPSEFDPRLGLLTVAGQACSLRPRTAAVLEELLKHPRRLVTRAELMRAVWPGLVVTANSVEQCVSELRRDLDGASGATLRTVPRRGYVLEAEVRSAEASRRTANGSRGLAVLPLVAQGAAGGRFADALTRDLIAAIARAPCVHVVSESTATSCASRGRDVRRVGRELGVDYVVDGRVAREGGLWKVSLTASETREAHQVWAERFEGDRSATVAEQRQFMASRASSLIASELTAVESRDGVSGGTRDAREMTKRAYFLWMRDLPRMSAEALALAQEASAVDPRAAGPWAMIAYWHACSISTRAASNRQEALAAAEAAARWSLSLDPFHRLAYGALGWALTHGGRHAEALVAFERQMALNPTPGTHHLLGRLHLLRGEPRRALAEVAEALALSGRDARRCAYLDTLALAHLHLRHDRRALDLARQAVAEPRSWPRAYETLAMALAANRKLADARTAIAELLRLWPGYTVAQHAAELAARNPAFLARHARLTRALARAGLPGR